MLLGSIMVCLSHKNPDTLGYANEKLQGTDQLSYTAQYTDDGQIYVEIQP